MKDSYPWCLHGMDKGPFFVLIFSFRQSIARPILRFCGLERFFKMHEAVYSPMHEDVYGRVHRLFSMHEVVYHCTRQFTPTGRIHCTRSFTPIYKNQCTRSFTTFSELRRQVTIGRKEGKRAFCMAENPPGYAFYPVKSCPVAGYIAPFCL